MVRPVGNRLNPRPGISRRILVFVLGAAVSAVFLTERAQGAASVTVYRSYDEDGTLILRDHPPGKPHTRPYPKSVERTHPSRASRRTPGTPESRSFPGPVEPPGTVVSSARVGDGRISYAYYEVGGSNAGQAIRMTSIEGPVNAADGRRYAAETRWSIGWLYDYEYRIEATDTGWFVGADVRNVSVKRRIEVLFPRAGDTAEWTAADRAHWDAYLDRLREHEMVHVALVSDEEVTGGIESDLAGRYEFEWPPSAHPPPREAIREAVESAVYDIGARWIDLVKDRNDRYDALTEHGKNPSAGRAFLEELGL